MAGKVKLTPAQRAQVIREAMQEIGAKGGRAQVPKGTAMLTPEQRKAQSAGAAALRWARYRRDNGLPAKPGDAELLKSER